MRWDNPPLDINPVFPGLGENIIVVVVAIIIIIIIITIIIIIIIIIVYVDVFSTCTDFVEKRVRFTEGLSLVLLMYFRFFFLFLYCEL